MIIKTSYPFMKPPPSARLIRGHHLAQDLVFFPSFNEGSGNKVFDLSGNGNTGTLQADTHFVPGKFGSAIDFDGAGDYALIPHSSSLSLINNFTISVWINTRALNDINHRILHKNAAYSVYMFEADSKIAFFHYGYGGPIYGDIGTLSTNKWFHIVYVQSPVDGGSFYVNGVDNGGDATKTNDVPTNTNPVHIGLDEDLSSFPFDGLIDHITIFNRALSASEIALLYREPFCMFERKARVALMSGYAVPPVGAAGIMTTNTGYWGPTF